MRWRAALVVLGLGLIAACGPKSEQGSGGAPAAKSSDQVITAAEMPRPRPGYWERRVSADGGVPRVTHFCQSDAPATIGDVGRGCSAFTYRRTLAGRVLIDAACAEGPISTTLHVTMSGDFNASYATDSEMSLTLQGHPPQRFVTHAEARYLGADCPPGDAGAD
jgi:hypothetical protein